MELGVVDLGAQGRAEGAGKAGVGEGVNDARVERLGGDVVGGFVVEGDEGA